MLRLGADRLPRRSWDDDTEAYPYGYCPRSERFYALKLGHRTERISMVAGWCNRQVLTPMTYPGHCDTQLFEA